MTTSGFCLALLLVAFIVLKLCHVIAWSWLWVLAPLWLPLLAAMVIMVVLVLFFMIKELL